MFYKTLKAFLLTAALAADGCSAAETIRGAGREEIVVTYDRSVSMDEVFDVLEEAKARFHRQLSCTRGMVVDVDAEGRELIESIPGMKIGVSPHDEEGENLDADEEGQTRRLQLDPDFGTEFGFQDMHSCEVCPGHTTTDSPYVLTVAQVEMIKGMIKANITAGVDDPNACRRRGNCVACGLELDQTLLENADTMVDYHLYNANTNGVACNVTAEEMPFRFGAHLGAEGTGVGKDSFDGSLGSSAGALVRNAFHDCGTMDVNGNVMLSGCNGCVSLKANSNRGLENANAFLKELKKDLFENHGTYITMADLIPLASNVAIEETVKRFQYIEDYNCIYRDFDNDAPETEKIEACLSGTRFMDHLNIPFKYGREDIWQSESLECECELTELPGPEPNLSTGMVWTREELGPTMLDKLDFSIEEYCTLIGAHTLGRLDEPEQGYQGSWHRDFDEFSNLFYRFGSGRNLQKTVNTRTMIDVHGDDLEVVATEWFFADNSLNPEFPFIFLNSDISCVFNLAHRDNETGTLCNVTDGGRPTDPDDIICPKFNDAAANDFQHFGTDAGYLDWLEQFSLIYKRMTDELVPCGTLRPPAQTFDQGLLCIETGFGCNLPEEARVPFLPDGAFQSVRDDGSMDATRRKLATNKDPENKDQRDLQLDFQFGNSVNNNFGYLSFDCHTLDHFCDQYHFLYGDSICQRDSNGAWIEFRYGFGFDFTRNQICRMETDLADEGQREACLDSPVPDRKLFPDLDDFWIHEDDSPCQILPDVVLGGPSLGTGGLWDVMALGFYQIIGCHEEPERRNLQEDENAAAASETEQNRKLQEVEPLTLTLGAPVLYTTTKEGFVYSMCPMEAYASVSPM